MRRSRSLRKPAEDLCACVCGAFFECAPFFWGWVFKVAKSKEINRFRAPLLWAYPCRFQKNTLDSPTELFDQNPLSKKVVKNSRDLPHSFQGSFFSGNHQNRRGSSRFLKRRLVEKNGESTPRRTHCSGLGLEAARRVVAILIS